MILQKRNPCWIKNRYTQQTQLLFYSERITEWKWPCAALRVQQLCSLESRPGQENPCMICKYRIYKCIFSIFPLLQQVTKVCVTKLFSINSADRRMTSEHLLTCFNTIKRILYSGVLQLTAQINYRKNAIKYCQWLKYCDTLVIKDIRVSVVIEVMALMVTLSHTHCVINVQRQVKYQIEVISTKLDKFYVDNVQW